MQIISAVETATGYTYLVNLAPEEADSDGNPLHTIERTWGKQPPQDVTPDAYKASILRELGLLAEDEATNKGLATAAKPEPVKRLSAEGMALSEAIVLGKAAFAEKVADIEEAAIGK